MKKILSVLLVIMLLCSCSGGEITPHLCGIGFKAEMTYYNESYAFLGELSENGTLKAEITAPEELSELVITISHDSTTVNYKGLTYTPVEGTMPFSAMLEDFYNPIKAVIDSGLTADKNGKLTVGSGTDKAEFTLSPTGLPQKLELPDERFSVTFYNVSVKEDVND